MATDIEDKVAMKLSRLFELETIFKRMGIWYDENQNLWRSSEHDALVDRLKHSLAAAIEARNWYADKVHQMMRDNDAV